MWCRSSSTAAVPHHLIVGRFGHVVGHAVRERDFRVRRTDDDGRAALALADDGVRRGAEGVIRPHHRHVERLAEAFEVGRVKRLAVRIDGGRDEAIEAAELPFDVGDHPIHGRLIGDVQRAEQGLAAEFANLLGGRFGPFGHGQVIQGDIGPGLAKPRPWPGLFRTRPP